MKAFSPQLPCLTSSGNVEALASRSARAYVFPFGTSKHHMQQQQIQPCLACKTKLSCRKPWRLDGIASRHTVNMAVRPGTHVLILFTSLSSVHILLFFENVGNFVGIYHGLPSLPSFTGIISNYKIFKDWSKVCNTHIKQCDLRDRKWNDVLLKSRPGLRKDTGNTRSPEPGQGRVLL